MASTDQARQALAPRKAEAPKNTAMALIERMQPEIERALPKALTIDRFMRIALTTMRLNPQLAECSQQSLLGALMVAAQLGLEPGGPLGFAYILPFGKDATFVLGYKGTIALAFRSAELKSIEAREVYENDEFEYEYGLNPVLRHVPTDGDRGALKCFYGVAHFKNGGYYYEVVPLTEIERHRKMSKAANSPAWRDHYVAMGKKTVVNVMKPYLPLSSESMLGLAQDESVHYNVVAPDDLADVIEGTVVDGETGEVLASVVVAPPVV